MTAAPAPFSPPNRSVLAWWRDLAALQPRRLWTASLWFHRVEARVAVDHSARIEPLQLGILRSFLSTNGVPEHLGLDRHWSGHLLGALKRDGLLEQGPEGPRLTESGRRAAGDGTHRTQLHERRSFHFLDNSACQRPPHYLHLHRSLSPAATPPEHWSFDANLLPACVAQPVAWKQAHGFPDDIRAIDLPQPTLGADPMAWQRVLIDHPEQAPLVLIERVDEKAISTLHGFTIRMENWTIFRDAPLFSLPEDWPSIVPDLANAPTNDDWRQAWIAWSRARGVTTEEAEKCNVGSVAERVRVRAPKRIVDSLKAVKGDPLKLECCLLAGAGRCRRMAMMDVETEPEA